jgi:hypothetical protein
VDALAFRRWVSVVIAPVGFICVPRVLCEVWTYFLAMGTGRGFVPQVREIEALSSSVEIMVASPLVHFQAIR